MPDERFALLVNLGKKISDYAVEKDVGGDGMSIKVFGIALSCYFWKLQANFGLGI